MIVSLPEVCSVHACKDVKGGLTNQLLRVLLLFSSCIQCIWKKDADACPPRSMEPGCIRLDHRHCAIPASPRQFPNDDDFASHSDVSLGDSSAL